MVAIVLIGIITQAFACNYERMSRIPNYARITTPKKVVNIPGAHDICFAPNGNYAVISWNGAGKIYMYYGCGKLMKAVNIRNKGYHHSGGCVFTERSLYVTSQPARTIYELTSTGEFVRIFAKGQAFMRITVCRNRLYVTAHQRGHNVFIYDTNGKEIRRLAVPGHARGVVVGTDDLLYVSNWAQKSVHTFTLEGRKVLSMKVRLMTYKEIRIADGIAMDSAGNILIADQSPLAQVVVYSPCGALIKTIRTRSRTTAGVSISNDGTIMVADHQSSKVFMY